MTTLATPAPNAVQALRVPHGVDGTSADGANQHPILTAAALGGLQIQYDGVDERVISWR